MRIRLVAFPSGRHQCPYGPQYPVICLIRQDISSPIIIPSTSKHELQIHSYIYFHTMFLLRLPRYLVVALATRTMITFVEQCDRKRSLSTMTSEPCLSLCLSLYARVRAVLFCILAIFTFIFRVTSASLPAAECRYEGFCVELRSAHMLVRICFSPN